MYNLVQQLIQKKLQFTLSGKQIGTGWNGLHE